MENNVQNQQSDAIEITSGSLKFKYQPFSKRKFYKNVLIVVAVFITLVGAMAAGGFYYFTYANKVLSQQNLLANTQVCDRSKKYFILPATQQKITESDNYFNKAQDLVTKTQKGINPSSDDAQNLVKLLQQSINSAHDATDLEPENPITWEQLGKIYASVAGINASAKTYALSSFQQALKIDPKDCIALVGIGNVYINDIDYPSAISYFKKVTQLFPNYPDGHLYLAAAYKLNDQKSDADKEAQLGNTLKEKNQ